MSTRVQTRPAPTCDPSRTAWRILAVSAATTSVYLFGLQFWAQFGGY